MHIPAYQIHNVLNTYSLQLFKAGNAAQDADSGSDSHAGKISPEASRMAVVDKVAAEIVQRITRLDSLTAVPPPGPAEQTDDAQFSENHYKQFVFNSLDTHNVITSRILSIEDSIFSIKRDPP